MGTAANLDIGPCSITFNSIDLGYTIGGVKVSVATETKDIEVDQEVSPVDTLIQKQALTVVVPLAEYTLENLNMALPGSEIVTDATDATKKKLLLKSQSGASLITFANTLVLHPTSLEDTDKSEDWTFNKAAPVGNLEVLYDKENPKVAEVTFKIFPDTDNTMGIFGDITATPA